MGLAIDCLVTDQRAHVNIGRGQHTSGSLGSFYVQNHVHSLFNLDDTLAIRGADWAHIHRHTLPCCIKQFVAVEEA